MEVLLIKSDLQRNPEWANAFAEFDVEVRYWEKPGAVEDIDYALVWEPEAGVLAGFPNLKLIFSIGAGIDHLTGDNIVPPGIPVIRMVDDALTTGMAEYVVFHVLRFHRFMHLYEAEQREKIWKERLQVPAGKRRVGLLGMGVLGGKAAEMLATLGFDVAGWSRSKKTIPGVTSYYGESQLAEFLARTEILVCLLPLTADTENILNAENFARLPKGAFVINSARGEHCNEEDLLAALDSGQVAGAALDVFKHEPLNPNSPLWDHPRVYITPHVASMTVPASSSNHVKDNITRFRNAQPLQNVVDFELGY